MPLLYRGCSFNTLWVLLPLCLGATAVLQAQEVPRPAAPFARPLAAPVPGALVPGALVPGAPVGTVGPGVTVAPTPSVAPAAAVPPMATPRPLPDGRFHLQLKDGSLVVARFPKHEFFKMKSTVGPVEIPRLEITSIHFLPDGSCKIAFRNGDSLSGRLTDESLPVETSFGTAEIPLDKIAAAYSQEHVAGNGKLVQRVVVQGADGPRFHWTLIAPGTLSPRTYPATPASAPALSPRPTYRPAPRR